MHCPSNIWRSEGRSVSLCRLLVLQGCLPIAKGKGLLKLGSLKGRGKVEVQGRIIGEIDYEIEVWQNGQIRTASGAATGGDAHAIASAFNTGISILHLQTGGAVRFVVTHTGPRGAMISIDGPVPGF